MICCENVPAVRPGGEFRAAKAAYVFSVRRQLSSIAKLKSMRAHRVDKVAMQRVLQPPPMCPLPTMLRKHSAETGGVFRKLIGICKFIGIIAVPKCQQ